MAGNRKQPFGYRMEFGEYTPHPAEAETVRWIYQTYLAGASYQELVEALQERGIAYDEGKLWNKNMVARILEDKRYSGTDRYPAILPEEQYRGAQERRRDRAVPVRKTPAQMELRRLCGGPPPAWVEQQTLTLLNRLVQHPERIASGQTEMEDPAESRNTGSTPLGRRNMRRRGSRSSSGTIRSWRNWSGSSCVRASDRSHTEEKAFRSG